MDTQQADDQRNIAKQQKTVERYLHKRQVLLQRKDECNKNIRDLGVLPEEAFVETTASSEKVRWWVEEVRHDGTDLRPLYHSSSRSFARSTRR